MDHQQSINDVEMTETTNQDIEKENKLQPEIAENHQNSVFRDKIVLRTGKTTGQR